MVRLTHAGDQLITRAQAVGYPAPGQRRPLVVSGLTASTAPRHRFGMRRGSPDHGSTPTCAWPGPWRTEIAMEQAFSHRWGACHRLAAVNVIEITECRVVARCSGPTHQLRELGEVALSGGGSAGQPPRARPSLDLPDGLHRRFAPVPVFGALSRQGACLDFVPPSAGAVSGAGGALKHLRPGRRPAAAPVPDRRRGRHAGRAEVHFPGGGSVNGGPGTRSAPAAGRGEAFGAGREGGAPLRQKRT